MPAELNRAFHGFGFAALGPPARERSFVRKPKAEMTRDHAPSRRIQTFPDHPRSSEVLERPTPIQAQVWPVACEGLDVIGIVTWLEGGFVRILLSRVLNFHAVSMLAASQGNRLRVSLRLCIIVAATEPRRVRGLARPSHICTQPICGDLGAHYCTLAPRQTAHCLLGILMPKAMIITATQRDRCVEASVPRPSALHFRLFRRDFYTRA